MSLPLRACAGALVLATLAMLGWPRSSGAEPRVLACSHAVQVDGELRCDDEAPRTVGELCDDQRGEAIAPGDAIDRATVCACTSGAARCGFARMAAEDISLLQLPVDVNAASLDELATLPGVGPAIAARVIAGRPYAEIEELERVRGIGPKTLARMRPRVRVR